MKYFLFDFEGFQTSVILEKILDILKNGTKEQKCSAIFGLMEI